MSLTNPNKVVTEQRLNEYHNAILPYLGGMPEMVANKFSRSDLYSTEEKMIGQWIDGKPLYARTFTTTIPKAEGETWKSIGSVPGMNIVKKDAFFSSSNGDLCNENNGYVGKTATTSEMYISVITRVQNDTLEVFGKALIDNHYPLTCNVTIKYTKTTDSPISIGSDTDYSTEEKIVGTWIDGKPVYQKTIVKTSNLNTAFAITSDSIEKLIDVKAQRYLSTNGTQVTYPYVPMATNITDYSQFVVSGYFRNQQWNPQIGSSVGTENDSYTWTFQYTKTTD